MRTNTPLICPECRSGKHANCSGEAFDFDTDRPVPCMCTSCADAGPADDRAAPAIEGMVDDLGRPATIYTPPEMLRRDPNRWPTPAEFVSEWEQLTPERRVQMAERILADGQAVEPLRRERDKARVEVERLQHSEVGNLLAEIEALRSDEPITPFCDRWQMRREIRRAEAAEATVARVEDVARFPRITMSSAHGPLTYVRVDDLRAALADPEPAQVQQADERRPGCFAICPECVQGKHDNCVGEAFDFVTDRAVPCTCLVCSPTAEEPAQRGE